MNINNFLYVLISTCNANGLDLLALYHYRVEDTDQDPALKKKSESGFRGSVCRTLMKNVNWS
jgi:hypothetical protein